MTIPSPSQLLQVWEQGLDQPPVGRVLLLLGAADVGREEGEASRLTVGGADRCLLQLRRSLFGGRFNAVCACPRCRETMELDFDSEQLATSPAAESGAEPRQLAVDNWRITFRIPSLHDLADAGQRPDANSARALLLERCVLHAEQNGVAITPHELPAPALTALSSALQNADPQAATELSLNCPACQHAWTSAFDLGAFLWSELHAWAGRMLREVHVLARHYGWSESDILALPPRRRRQYLEMIAA
jgi:hypothetical protein